MLLIPAIDLKDGRCVRLQQGDMQASTVFSEDPAAMARRWLDAGARRLHLVDLNGAFAGKPVNEPAIKAILAEVGDEIPVQLGGGIRDLDTIERYLDDGLSYVIIGTAAVKNPGFLRDACSAFGGHILVGLDARDGKVATDGWSKLTGHEVVDLARKFEDYGVEGVIYTDIGRDGMLSGINVEATVRLAQALTMPVIASGGLKGLTDIEQLCAVEDEGIEGVICGRAIYTGDLDFAAAQARADALAAAEAGASRRSTGRPGAGDRRGRRPDVGRSACGSPASAPPGHRQHGQPAQQQRDRGRLGDRRQEAADLAGWKFRRVDVQVRRLALDAGNEGREGPSDASAPDVRDEGGVVACRIRHVEQLIVAAAGDSGRKADQGGHLGGRDGSAGVGRRRAAMDVGDGRVGRQPGEARLDTQSLCVLVEGHPARAGTRRTVGRHLGGARQRGDEHNRHRLDGGGERQQRAGEQGGQQQLHGRTSVRAGRFEPLGPSAWDTAGCAARQRRP
jgi:phosphoribosylformimino-5-aminoimidazole carboxamide ribotide isomerase